MATSAATAFQPNNNYSKLYLAPGSVPSPPNSYGNGKNMSVPPSEMAQPPPPWNWEVYNRTPALWDPKIRNRMPGEDYGVHVEALRRPAPKYGTPAALRPTVQPGRAIPTPSRFPDTPPGSQSNSLDNSEITSPLYGHTILPSDGENEGLIQLPYGMTDTTVGRLEEEEDDVVGPPTTAHWKPDEMNKACAICNVSFTWYFRRHHCRACGKVVCVNHFKHKVPLDHNARFNSKGEQSKVCPLCNKKWKALQKARADSRASSLAESQTESPDASLAAVPIQQRAKPAEEQHAGSYAKGFAFHAWSTF